MKLQKDAKIFNATNDEIGNLNRFVLDARTKQVTHIVFERGLLNKDEYVVPFEHVQRIDEEGIHLGLKGDLKDLPPFEETEYVATNERALLEGEINIDSTVGNLYFYPHTAYGPAGWPGAGYERFNQETGPTIPRGGTSFSSEPAMRQETEMNIPDGTVALKEGAKIISSDNKHVGDVEKVLVDPRSERATHLLMIKGMLSKEKKLLPLDWVDSILEEEILLVMDQDFIENLPEYKE